MEIMEKNIAQDIRRIMDTLGIEITESNEETPYRIARMLNRELFKHRNNSNIGILTGKMTTFKNPQGDKVQPIIIKGIKFYSTCEHHWLPFFGECDIEYTPTERILGLSKFPRVVKYFSKKPQVQERLTKEIGEYLVSLLEPQSLKVTLRDVTHTCVCARGIEAECTTTTVYEY